MRDDDPQLGCEDIDGGVWCCDKQTTTTQTTPSTPSTQTTPTTPTTPTTVTPRPGTCSDGNPVVSECDAQSNTCTADPELGCEMVNGKPWCCKTSTTTSTMSTTTTPTTPSTPSTGSTPSTASTASMSTTPTTPSTSATKSTSSTTSTSTTRTTPTTPSTPSTPTTRQTPPTQPPGPCPGQTLVDSDQYCPNMAYLCNNVVYSQLMKTNCRKTCGVCNQPPQPPVVPATQAPQIVCTDAWPDCAVWRYNGFCQSPYYSLVDKRRFWGVTCQLCGAYG
ncbi:Metridin-like ShK toxin [Aphelenchoides avenae]|nr:Metridin-like ShK toxin [Aphelenchus avenae]